MTRTAPLAVVVVVAAAAVGYGTLTSFVEDPRVFGDEVTYMEAASSLAHGQGLKVRRESYGFAPGYPAVLAPIIYLTPDRSSAYAWVKRANALFFALAAVPIYLLSCRVLTRRVSVGVAAAAVGIPSSIYVGSVLTEGLSYLVSSVALLAIALTVERSTWKRQAAALASIALSYLVRPEFVVLFPAYLSALVIGVVLVQHRHPSSKVRGRRRMLQDLWPTAVALLVVVVVVLAIVVPRGASTLGGYSGLWQSYDVWAIGRWMAYHVTDLGLYLGLVPLALLPVMLASVVCRGWTGSRPHLALFSVFVTTNASLLLVTAAFSSTPSGYGALYDRYLFYVVPLWLVLFAAWLADDGAPRSRLASFVGTGFLLALIAAFPANRLVVDDGYKEFHATAIPLWVQLQDRFGAHGLTGHRAMVIAAVAAAAVAYVLPRRWAWLLVIPVAAALIANSVLVWKNGIEDAHKSVFADRSSATQGWVDEVVPAGQSVTMLLSNAPHCPRLGYAYLLTEFFNDRIDSAPILGARPFGGLPSETLHLAAGGKLIRPSGSALRARWLVGPPGIEVKGVRRAAGTVQHLVLWRIRGVAIVHGRSDRQIEGQACS